MKALVGSRIGNGSRSPDQVKTEKFWQWYMATHSLDFNKNIMPSVWYIRHTLLESKVK